MNPPAPTPGPLPLSPPPFDEAVDAARTELEARIERFPSYPDLWNRLGLYQAHRGMLVEAAACFERALALNPRFLGALENRAWTAIAQGDRDAWQRFFDGQDYVRLHPGVRHHLLCFATSRFESPSRARVMSGMPPQGRYEAAHLLDRLAIEIELGKFDEARLLVEDMTSPDPALRGAFTAAGIYGSPASEESWRAWARTYAYNPQFADVASHMARWCQGEKQSRESRQLVDWTLALSLDLATFWVNLALHHDAVGDGGRVLPCLERAVAANPQHRRARKELALGLMRRGRAREAIEAFEHLREVAPHFADVRFHLGVLYLERGDLEEAATEFTAALGANPRFTRAALLLARTRFDQERWVEARAAFERVLADGQDETALRIQLAQVYDHLGEAELAGESFRRAGELGPDDAELYRTRSEWLERQGRNAEAAADRARLDDLLRNNLLDEAA